MMGGKRKLVEGGGGDASSSSASKSSRRPGGGGVVDVDDAKVAISEVDDNASDRRTIGGDGGDSSRIVARETNPLLNELILQNLFSHMPVELLAPSRLVCRLWRDASLSSWRGSAAPRIICSKRRAGQNHYFLKSWITTSLQDFMGFAEANCVVKPYRQFRLDRWLLQEHGMDAGAASFWKVLGSSITKLRLENCTSSRSAGFFKTVNKLCPRVESLVLSNCQFGSRDNWSWKLNEELEYKEAAHGEHPNLRYLRIVNTGGGYFLPSHIYLTHLELLTHFPNLTTLNLEGGWGMVSPLTALRPQSLVLKFLLVVQLIRRRDPRKLPITKLDGFVVVVDQVDPRAQGEASPPRLPSQAPPILDLLQELNLPLQSARLTDKLNLDEVQNFVEIYGRTLRSLEVEWDVHSRPRCNFPFGVALPNLEHLRIPEGFCADFGFLKYTPNLKSLMICVDLIRFTEPVTCGGKTTLIESTAKSSLANTELLNLTTLELEGFTVTEDDLRWLVKWMPKVKNLTMVLDDEMFPIVCENWQDLTRLKVMGNGLTDKGLTGRVKYNSMTTRAGTGRWEKAIRPNVTSLRNLEVFVAHRAALSEGSLNHGFLKLRRLRRLFFENINMIGDRTTNTLLGKGIKISEID